MPQQPLAQVPDDVTWFWQEHGACLGVDPTLFFHPQNERGNARMKRDQSAQAVCARCPVRLDCADYAIRAREPYGVWGGLTEDDRQQIYRRMDSGNYPRHRGAGLAAVADAFETSTR